MVEAKKQSGMKPRSVLDRINRPADLRSLNDDELRDLAAEVRDELLEVVSKRGGHLASNLGVVELTIALLRTFSDDSDRIVWDTGHQGYVHKLLTGRRELFQNLRQNEGCCGFLHRDESAFDVFGAGHAGTAISAATGLAVARDASGAKHRIVAVVGDGALGCGVSLEGLNNIIEETDDLILVINDNRMSISPNVGALSRYLTRLISSQSYNQLRSGAGRMLDKLPIIGRPLRRLIHRMTESAKGVIVPGLIFEELGLRYIGPIDGHDLKQLTNTLERVARLPRKKPLALHVITQKGAGYKPAEDNPSFYHGLPAFDRNAPAPTAPEKMRNGHDTFSGKLGKSVCRVFEKHQATVAITAGMCEGTGLHEVRSSYPKRFIDVGIAEEHAVVLAAGMAAGGLQPIVAIYATFMQRALDYVFHDVCLQNLPVVFCLDRAGVVADGPTHHGIHDLGFWQTVPNLTVMQPMDGDELEAMLEWAVNAKKPCVIRYPRSKATTIQADKETTTVEEARACLMRDGTDVALFCLGREVATGLEVADKLQEQNVSAAVVNVRFVQPLDTGMLKQYAARMPVATIEDHCIDGGLGTRVAALLTGTPEVKLMRFGWPTDQVIPFGTVNGLRKQFKLDPESIAKQIAATIHC